MGYGGIVGSYPFRSFTNAYASPLKYSIATPVATPVAPVTTNAIPVSTSVLKTVAAAPSTSQHHKQDEFGNYEYGYANINSFERQKINSCRSISIRYSPCSNDGHQIQPRILNRIPIVLLKSNLNQMP